MSPAPPDPGKAVLVESHPDPADSTFVSRAIYAFQRHSTHPAVAVAAIVISVASLIAALTSRSPAEVLAWFAGLASAVTLPMLFVLQHTESRHQLAIQRKLDEVLHALPGADNRLIGLEAASETDLNAIAEKHSALIDRRAERRDEASGPGS